MRLDDRRLKYIEELLAVFQQSLDRREEDKTV